MPMSCQHDITKEVRHHKTIGKVDCLQMQYFKPLAYTGDYLVTAMTNVRYNLSFTMNFKFFLPPLKRSGWHLDLPLSVHPSIWAIK